MLALFLTNSRAFSTLAANWSWVFAAPAATSTLTPSEASMKYSAGTTTTGYTAENCRHRSLPPSTRMETAPASRRRAPTPAESSRDRYDLVSSESLGPGKTTKKKGDCHSCRAEDKFKKRLARGPVLTMHGHHE